MFHLQSDYYIFLKLRRNASCADIAKAVQAKREHIIALCQSEGTLRQKLLRLNKMESILLDPEARAKYDTSLPPEKHMDVDDYCLLLNVSQDASSEDIWAAFEIRKQLYKLEKNKVNGDPAACKKLAGQLREFEQAKNFLLKKRHQEEAELSTKSQRVSD